MKKRNRLKRALVSLFFLSLLSSGLYFRPYFNKKFFSAQQGLYTYRYPVEQNEFSSYQEEFDKIKNFYLDKIKRDPHDAQDKAMLAHYYLGAAREFSRDDYFEEAAKFALASLKQRPSKNFSALRVLAELALARHENKRALKYGFTLLKMDPLTPEVYSILIKSYLQSGELKEANRFADNLIHLFPNENSYTLRAEVLSLQGRTEEAWVDYNQAFLLEEENVAEAVRTRNSFARFCKSVGLLDLAEKVLKEALRINPLSSRTLNELGELKLKTKKLDDAAAYFKQAFQESTQLTSLYAQARVAREKGEMLNAKNLISKLELIFREQVRKNKRSVNAEALIRLLLERGSPRDIREGLRLARAQQARRLDSESTLLLAWAHEKNNNLLEARKGIRDILSKNIKTPALFNRASSIEKKLKNKQLADVYSKQAALETSSDSVTLDLPL